MEVVVTTGAMLCKAPLKSSPPKTDTLFTCWLRSWKSRPAPFLGWMLQVAMEYWPLNEDDDDFDDVMMMMMMVAWWWWFVFCLVIVLVRLSLSTSPSNWLERHEMTYIVLMGTLNPCHSLTLVGHSIVVHLRYGWTARNTEIGLLSNKKSSFAYCISIMCNHQEYFLASNLWNIVSIFLSFSFLRTFSLSLHFIFST